uniref:ADP,ATP carrier protein n=1 Tax=Aegilops tauschii subsp. strangulata TaxID=200361 RepID=A0A453IFG0_AEGTS
MIQYCCFSSSFCYQVIYFSSGYYFLLLLTFLSIISLHDVFLSGTFDAITKMMHYEGLSGLYKGMGTKIVQSVFASALLFMIKEELVKGARFLVTGDTSLVKKLPSKPSR